MFIALILVIISQVYTYPLKLYPLITKYVEHTLLGMEVWLKW